MPQVLTFIDDASKKILHKLEFPFGETGSQSSPVFSQICRTVTTVQAKNDADLCVPEYSKRCMSLPLSFVVRMYLVCARHCVERVDVIAPAHF